MSNVDSHDRDAIYDQLVAYLDGELDDAEAARIERRVAEDEAFQQHLRDLQQSWDLLEDLPRTEVDDKFTNSTIEMVAVRAEELAEEERSAATRRRQLRLFAKLALVAGVAGLGFLGVSYWLQSPNRRLLNDLPVVENLDALRRAESVEFLRDLNQQKLFDENENDDL